MCFCVSRLIACDGNAPINVKPAGGGGGRAWGGDLLSLLAVG